jgi:hypothetical protein
LTSKRRSKAGFDKTGSTFTDPRKAPNHSWRHRFQDLCPGAGIEKAIHHALTGHSSSDEGDKYGLGYPLAMLVKAIEKLPEQIARC